MNPDPTVHNPASLTFSEPSEKQASELKVEQTYLALGDSYTIGESVREEERWSVQLVRMLREKGKNVALPDIIARTGWTTAELLMAIKASGNVKRYTLVSLLIGVNNQYRGLSVEIYRSEFRELLDTAVHFSGGNPSNVFVLSIPDWGVTPFASSVDRNRVANEIDLFNGVAEKECNRTGIAFINITELSRAMRNDPDMVASDRLHFSGKMYALWAKASLPVVERMLD